MQRFRRHLFAFFSCTCFAVFVSLCSGEDIALRAVVLDRFQGDTVWSLSSADEQQGSSAFAASKWGGNLRYDFSQELGSILISAEALRIPGKPERFEIQVYGDLSGHLIAISLADAHGQEFRKTCVREPAELSTGACNYTATWSDGTDWLHDGKVQCVTPTFPLAVNGIVVEASPDAAVRGTVSFLQLAVHTWASDDECVRVSFPKTRHRGLYLLKTFSSLFPFQIPVLVENLATHPYKAQGQIQVLDADGFNVGSQQWSFEVPGLQHHDDPIELEPDRQGFFRLTLSGIGSSQVHKDFILSRELHPRRDRVGSFFGMDLRLVNQDSSEERLFIAFRAAQAGVRWSREEFNLSGGIQSLSTWQQHNDSLKVAKKESIQLTGLLTYSDSLESATPSGSTNSIPDSEAWTQGVTSVVTRYQDQIRHWELSVLPENRNPQVCLELLKTTHEAIKAIDSDLKVVARLRCGSDMDGVRALFETGAGDFLDIISLFPDGHLTGDGLLTQIDDVLSLMAERNCCAPLWVTVGGLSDDMTPREQAEMLARISLQCAGVHAIERVFWGFFADGDMNAGGCESTLGIVRRDFTPKPAYLALKTVAQHLAGSVVEATADLGSELGVHALVLSREDSRIMALWSDADFVNISLPLDGSAVTMCDLWGRRVQLISRGGGILVPVQTAPVFLTFPKRVNLGIESVSHSKQERVTMARGEVKWLRQTLPASPKEIWEGAASVEATEGLLLHSPTSLVEMRESLAETVVSATIEVKPDAPLGDHLVRWEFRNHHIPFGAILQRVVVTPYESEAD